MVWQTTITSCWTQGTNFSSGFLSQFAESLNVDSGRGVGGIANIMEVRMLRGCCGAKVGGMYS